MADGTVYIDTRMDTSGFDSGSENMEKTMDKTSVEIQKILSNTEKSAKSKAASIAAIYRKQGLSQQEAFKKAWEEIERDTKQGSKKVNNHIKSIGKQSETTGKSMTANLSNAILKLGTIIGTTFAVSKLINFGKSAIDLGSDLQEVQNVVDVTFSTMNEAVNEFAKNAAETAGLSETMAKRYTGTFGAMAKAFGFAEGQAFDMATSLTQLSGDVASFYNLTQDEAYTKLKSVFTGETESLKDLGVVMTQTALDSYAMAKGFGKTTSQMSEQEKVALRYSFVLDQLSSAQGDFVRTSDSWANQTRILSLNFDSFKANIGQALINIFTPFLKVLNQIVDKMAQLSQRFVAFSEMLVGKSTSGGGGSPGIAEEYEAISESSNMAADGVDDFADSLKKANKEAKKTLSPLDNLNNITTDMAKNLGNAGYGDISIAKADSSINIEGEEEITKFEALVTSFAEKMTEVKDVIVNIYEKYIKKTFLSFSNDVKNLGIVFGEWFNGKIIPIFEKLRDRFIQIVEEKLGPLFEKLIGFVSKLWNDALKPFVEWISDKLAVFLPPVLEGFGMAFLNVFEKIIEIVSFLLDALNGLIDFIVNVFAGNWEAAWEGILDFFKGIINALISAFEGFINFVVDALNALINGANDLSSSVGINLNIGTIPRLNIPKLATGAVIPPNAPFMAMLGDQKHGTNIEAPLDTIKQALAEVMAEIQYVQNDRPIVIEIGGKEVFHVVQREAEEYFEATGREAFT